MAQVQRNTVTVNEVKNLVEGGGVGFKGRGGGLMERCLEVDMIALKGL